MSTIGIVWDRVNTIVATQSYAVSQDAFDFDMQPDTKLDHVFHLRSARIGTEGFLGGDQGERHQFTIYLAARAKRHAQGAARQLKVDMDLIEAAMLGDDSNEALGYFVEDDGVTSDCTPPPGSEADFVIGRLTAVVQFDHEM